MLLASLLLVSAAPIPARPVAPDHGRLPWFEGTYSQLLDAAEEAGKPIMIDFWTTWCGWCKRLDRDVFSDPEIVELLDGFLVWNVDAESKEGRGVARRFKVASFPTLVFLDADGSPRDLVRGYLPPERFAAEARRLLRNEDTVGGYEDRIAADPNDLDARLGLARKCEIFNDRIGHQRELREIEERDPEAKTEAGQYVRLEREKTGILMHWQQTHEIDTASLEAFLAEAAFTSVRHAGWDHIGQTRYNETKQLAGRASAERLAELRRLSREAYAEAWKHCPPERRVPWGTEMLGRYCEAKDLSPTQKSFALEVGGALVAAAPEDPPAHDALARAQQAVGAWDDALASVRRCVELEPENPQWQRRVQELEAVQR